MNWTLLTSRGIPKHVITALQNAMVLNPKKRTQSMGDFLRQLNMSLTPESHRPLNKENPIPSHKMDPRMLPFAIAVCAAVAALMIFLISPSGIKEEPQLASYKSSERNIPVESTVNRAEETESTLSAAPAVSADTTPIAQSESALKNVNPGDIIEFGKYRAAGDKDGQKEAIAWLVLAKDGDKILVMSVYGLDTQPYHTETQKITWDDSYIRKWLNGYFYEEAFSSSEKAEILETTVKPEKVWDCSPGEETSDSVFLLSKGDVSSYIEDNVYLDDIREIMHCKPTSSAKTQDIYVNDDGACWWWLRNTSRNNTIAYRVSSDGLVDVNGYELKTKRGLVRPAMWLRTE